MANEYDLYTIVAGDAVKRGGFRVRCNCGGQVALTGDAVKCACGARIKVLVVEGDPGYIIGQTSSGEPTLLPVQGSTAKPLHALTADERKAILEKALEAIKSRPN